MSKGKWLAILLPLTFMATAKATITSIGAFMEEGEAGTKFNGTVLHVSRTTALNAIVVSDHPGGTLTGFTPTTFNLETTFEREIEVIPGVHRGRFVGGAVTLEFWDGPTRYEISGEVIDFVMAFDVLGSTFTRFYGEGRFRADQDALSLPGSGVWEENVVSTIQIDELLIAEDLSEFTWSSPGAWTGQSVSESLHLFPIGAPEPSDGFILLAGAAWAVLRQGRIGNQR